MLSAANVILGNKWNLPIADRGYTSELNSYNTNEVLVSWIKIRFHNLYGTSSLNYRAIIFIIGFRIDLLEKVIE